MLYVCLTDGQTNRAIDYTRSACACVHVHVQDNNYGTFHLLGLFIREMSLLYTHNVILGRKNTCITKYIPAYSTYHTYMYIHTCNVKNLPVDTCLI